MAVFYDRATIQVKAGKGGDGMVAFRREKYVPDGGPAGGDGGKGGSVIFKVDSGLRTLLDFRHKRHFKAKPGENGMSKSMYGRGAEDLIVKVPPGTIVRNAETKALIADLVEDGQEVVVAKGAVVVEEISVLQRIKTLHQTLLRTVNQGKSLNSI